MSFFSQDTTTHARLRTIVCPREDEHVETLKALAHGFQQTPKQIPYWLLYDEKGSEIFEQICELPEYYPTRTERSILEKYASEMILRSAPQGPLTLVELGSGSSTKTRVLLEAVLTRKLGAEYISIDISKDFLYTSARTLLTDYPSLTITAIAGTYHDALKRLPATDTPRLFLFLGSSIGNLDSTDAVALLRAIRTQMTSHDSLLVGFDLVKDSKIIEAAYNDSVGVTAAFNKNLVAHVNRVFGATFDLENLDHHAPYVPERERIEMRLIARERQQVFVRALNMQVELAPGEYIHTENSRKWTTDAFTTLAHSAGLEFQTMWTDDRAWFALALFKSVG